MIKVYVAGKTVARRDLPMLGGILWLEPYVYGDELGEGDEDVYVPRDLMLLKRADIVLVLIETGEERNTFIAAGIAYARDVPVMTVATPAHVGHLQMLRKISSATFVSRQGAFDALEIIGREEFEIKKQLLRHEGVADQNFELPYEGGKK